MPTTTPQLLSGSLSSRAVRHDRTFARLLAGVGIGVLSGLSAAGCGLTEARIQANEASAIGSLRGIVSAQIAYSTSCGAGAYAPSLEWLGKPDPATPGQPYLGADLAKPAPFEKSGYVFRIRSAASPDTTASCNGVPAGQGVLHWAVVAAPISEDTGSRHFAVTSEGYVYESPSPIELSSDSKPLPPAKLVR
jgi:hypothetical protein